MANFDTSNKNCYWVKPGSLMVGEYPFSRALANSKERMVEFLEAGFTFFLDLTEEGEMPSYYELLRKTAEQMGVRVEYKRMPIPDVGIPSKQLMISILDTIDRALADGHKVYVHCRGGIGRTATVAGCYLVRHGLTGDQALDAVQRMLEETQPGLKIPRAPGTYEQNYYVRTWSEKDSEPVKTVVDEPPEKRLKRYLGCLIGLAVCDSLGNAVESRPAGTFRPVTQMRGGGLFDLNPGEWTDDTAMALCVAESLIEKNGFDPQDQMNRYIRWRDTGHLSCVGKCIGITEAMQRALMYYQQTGNFIGEFIDYQSAENASLVRVAPVSMFYRKHPELAVNYAKDSSLITHTSATATDACRYFAGLVVGALNGIDKKILLSELYYPGEGDWSKEPLHPAISKVAEGSFKKRYPPAIRSTNYVVDSLEAALWGFYRSASFEEGVLMIVNLGDDADTTAAIYGQLAGAYYTIDEIPADWVQRLAMRDTIEKFARRLFDLSETL